MSTESRTIELEKLGDLLSDLACEIAYHTGHIPGTDMWLDDAAAAKGLTLVADACREAALSPLTSPTATTLGLKISNWLSKANATKKLSHEELVMWTRLARCAEDINADIMRVRNLL